MFGVIDRCLGKFVSGPVIDEIIGGRGIWAGDRCLDALLRWTGYWVGGTWRVVAEVTRSTSFNCLHLDTLSITIMYVKTTLANEPLKKPTCLAKIWINTSFQTRTYSDYCFSLL